MDCHGHIEFVCLIQDCAVKLAGAFQVAERVFVDDLDAWVVERAAIEIDQRRVGAGEVGDLGVEVDQRDLCYIGVLQRLARRRR